VQIGKLSARKAMTAGVGWHGDGGGLWLRVLADGRRYWLLRFQRGGRSREMGLGPQATLKLADARERARQARLLLLDGIDPIEARRQARAEAEGAKSFRECAEAFLAAHKEGWRNPKHRQQWETTLETYAYPVLGDLAVGVIDTTHVLRVLEPIWTEKPETASRLRGRIERVLDWATVRGYRSGDNPARWKGHLQALLPAKARVRSVKHHTALPWSDMPSFMGALRARDGVGARALEFAILTATRSGEVRGMTWAEIDLDAAVWTIPSERMKARKEHRVPLAGRALIILHEMKRLSDRKPGSLVFPGTKPGKALSDMSLTAVLRRMGHDDLTVHGFRSTFRDWAAESTNIPREVAEQALAHVLADKVEAAYRRGDLFAKRRRLMEAWAGFCERPAADNKASPIRKLG